MFFLLLKNGPKCVQFTYQAGLVMRVPALHGGDQLEQLGLLHLAAAACVVDLETWKYIFTNIHCFFSSLSPILSS